MKKYFVKNISGKLCLYDQHKWINSNPDNYVVIGKISPAAIWVKEGDEFNEEDIAQDSSIYMWDKESNTLKDFEIFFNKSLAKTHSHFIFEGESDNMDERGAVELIFKVYSKIYKIKCPTCKQFH